MSNIQLGFPKSAPPFKPTLTPLTCLSRFLWTVLAVFGIWGATPTSAQTNWPTSFANINYQNVIHNGDLFVALGFGGISTSADGISWTARNSNSTSVLTDGVWTGSMFVVVGENRTILTSPDGITWTKELFEFDGSFYGIAWNGTLFVAVGVGDANASKMVTSPNGVDWTEIPDMGTGYIYEIHWNGSQFLAVGDGGRIMTSPDGESWTTRTTDGDDFFTDVAWNGTVYAVTSTQGNILTSPDGVLWTPRHANASSSFQSIVWNGSLFSVRGYAGATLTSPDGVTWSDHTVASAENLLGSAWSGSQFVSVGDFGLIQTSPDGLSWTTRSQGTDQRLRFVSSKGLQTVAGGNSGTIVSTLDGATYGTRSTGTTATLNGISTDDSLFVVVGNSGTILTSPDGLTWTRRTSGTTNTLNAASWNGRVFAVVGNGGVVRTSPDGLTWTTRASGTTSHLFAVTWTGHAFVAVGNSGVMLTSTDGTTWSSLVSGTTANLRSVTWNGSLFVVTGAGGTIRTSPDGQTWTARVSGVGTSIDASTWTGHLFLISGEDGFMATSANGATWTSVRPSSLEPLYYHAAAWISSPTGSGPGRMAITGQSGIFATSTPDAPPFVPEPVYDHAGAADTLRIATSSTVTFTPANTGGQGVRWSSTPRLPSGLILDPVTGSITASAVSSILPANYVVRAENVGGFTTRTVRIGAGAPPIIAYSALDNYIPGSAMTPLEPTAEHTPTLWTITPSLPAGLSLNTNTGIVSGTPTVTMPTTNFTIIARNDFGFDTAVVAFSVQPEAPGAPTGVIAIGNSQRAYVTWTAPTYTGGASITSYTVTANPGGATCTWTTGPLACTIRDLDEEAAYTFTVTATNSAGTSIASPETEATTSSSSPHVSYPAPTYTFPMGTEINLRVVNPAPRATRWTISPNLTANTGLMINQYTGSILGVPVYLSGPVTYTITAIDTLTGRGDVITMTFATSAVAPEVAYLGSSFIFGDNQIDPITPVSFGGLITGWRISPDLTRNTGLLFNTVTGRITGKATQNSTWQPYVVTALGYGGTRVNVVLQIGTTLSAPEITYDAGPHHFTVNAAISPLTRLTTGTGMITGYTISPTLPDGLTFNTTSGKVEGTPRAPHPATTYTILAHGPGGTDTAVVTITVSTPALSVSYGNDSLVFSVGSAIATISRTNLTGIATRYAISPALPDGLNFNTTTGRIEGKPMVATPAADYTITVFGPAGQASDTLTITVVSLAPTVDYADDPLIFVVGSPITPVVRIGKTGTVSHYSIAPTLPAGLLFNTTSGVISGTPTVVTDATSYTITAHGPSGTGTDALTITTSTPAPTIRYSDEAYSLATGEPILPITRTSKTGMVTLYAISPTLPAGLRFNSTSGVISGTPTAASSSTPYEITAQGPGGIGRDTVLIATFIAAPSVSFDDLPVTLSAGSEIIPIGRTGKSGVITQYSIEPSLPRGLLFNATSGVIYGTPLVASAATIYTITAQGPSGTGSDQITLAVTANPPVLTFEESVFAFPLGFEVTAFRPSNTGGRIVKWSITNGSNGSSLNANTGLTFNPTTGFIQGVADKISFDVSYQITAYGLDGSSAQTSFTLSTLTARKPSSAEDESFSVRVTGTEEAYTLRLPMEQAGGTLITISIADLKGRTVWSQSVNPQDNIRTLVWDGRGHDGRRLPSGVYLVRVSARVEEKTTTVTGKTLTSTRLRR